MIELEDVRIARDLVLIYRKDKSLSRAAQAFIEIMHGSVGLQRNAAVS